MEPLPPDHPAKHREGETFYSHWSDGISPRYILWKRYDEMVMCITDKRPYKIELRDELIKLGAVLMESSTTIKSNSKRDDEDCHWDEPDSSLLLYKDNIIQISGDDVTVYYPISKQPVIDEFKPFLAPPSGAKVSILMQSAGGRLEFKSIEFVPPVIDDLALSYGAQFPAIHERIVEKLGLRKSGLMLFHGPAGTGKTSYIKHLTAKVDREFIFIPIGMAGELSSPSFLSLLMDRKEAVLILEDAEQAIQSREEDSYNASTVSTLLNLADGILGNLLNITIIASYNAERNNIDKALLRKGRLAIDYTFGKLSAEEATKLAKHLGKDFTATEATPLSDIYGADDDTNYKAPERKTMGFGGTTSG